jgi:hypothetical protein
MMEKHEILNLLNAKTADERLDNLKMLLQIETEKPKSKPQFANNHIHTFYSFSPYSPAAAIWFARAEGLQTAGIMDHDSIAGAEEFRAAGRLAGIGTTCGIECRVSFAETPLGDKKLNNPDQAGIAYMAIHSIPSANYSKAQAVFESLRRKRNERNKVMTRRLDSITAPWGIRLDFERHVLPLSRHQEGGSVTERKNAAEFVRDCLRVHLSEKQELLLSDTRNPYLQYDLLNVLKVSLLEQFYVPAAEECMSLADAVKLTGELDAILCYAYLGDVTDSPTGDKKAAKFEDDYLDELFAVLNDAGVKAVTFMPSRNTKKQLSRVMELCEKHNMLQISGEDVNSPRQSFICRELEDPRFSHLIEATWSMVNREK